MFLKGTFTMEFNGEIVRSNICGSMKTLINVMMVYVVKVTNPSVQEHS